MTIKFGQSDHDKDQDRHAWRAYASVALRRVPLRDERNFLQLSGELKPLSVAAAIALAAEQADAMLEEERKRR